MVDYRDEARLSRLLRRQAEARWHLQVRRPGHSQAARTVFRVDAAARLNVTADRLRRDRKAALVRVSAFAEGDLRDELAGEG
jgi:hypothetical protein